MMTACLRFGGSILLLWAIAGSCLARSYESTWEQSVWETEQSSLVCTLSHAIPFFGTGIFTHQAGEGLRYHMDLRRAPLKPGTVRIRAIPPSWRHDLSVAQIGELVYGTQKKALVSGEELARELLVELEQGKLAEFQYPDEQRGGQQQIVALSVVNFRPALRRFQDCVAALFPHSFAQVKHTTIHFDTNKHQLKPSERKKLDRLASYLELDAEVTQATISGHADERASDSHNISLSRRRAEAVQSYLQDQSVPQQQLQIEYFGETKPISKKSDETGWSKNRRVEINLIR